PSAVSPTPAAGQGAGGGRSGVGAGSPSAGTSGAAGGTNRADRRDLLTGWPIIVAVTLGFMVVNALTAQSDWPSVRPWAPWVWEGSSAVPLALLVWVPWLAGAAAPSSLL